ncbi:sugar ABC transporter substrate-binding protein [Thermoanaerobacteraceae bacterium SP2]|nr:sugar ABC transporter substrate-binding protein [Thermoanaerobacteraceae bacterium SP2]
MKRLNINNINFSNRNIIIIILLVLIALFGSLAFKLYKSSESVFAPVPKYHFYMVAPNSVDPFWKEVYKGAMDAAKNYNVALEFNAPRFNDSQEEMKYLEIAVTSRVDGIVTHVSYDRDFAALIDRADNGGIPVVTIENDAPKSRRKAFVGSNSFMLGEEAGKIMIKATGGKAGIAVIMANELQKDAANQNLKLNGFLNAIKAYPDMQVTDIYNSKFGILSAEEITQSILNSGKKIYAIYCMDSVDTIGTSQVVVDLNRVGDVKIVGYGDTPDILRYIDKGIIYGTVMSDPYKMGYESIKALIEIMEKDTTSTFIDTGVKIITKENLETYRKSMEKLQQ